MVLFLIGKGSSRPLGDRRPGKPKKPIEVTHASKNLLMQETRNLGLRFIQSPAGKKHSTNLTAAKKRFMKMLGKTGAKADAEAIKAFLKTQKLLGKTRKAYIRMLKTELRFCEKWLEFAKRQDTLDNAIRIIEQQLSDQKNQLKKFKGKA